MSGQLLSSSFLTPAANSNNNFDPLVRSTPNVAYGDVDPWSASPLPGPRPVSTTTTPKLPADGQEGTPSDDIRPSSSKDGLNGLIEDPPAIYLSLLDSLDPSPSGDLSLASVHRLLATSQLPASTVEKIINLTCRDKARLTRAEFFCTLALVALAQSSDSTDSELSIEALITAIPDLPLPRLIVPAVSASNGYSVPSTLGPSPWDTTPRVSGHPQPPATVSNPGSSFAESSRELEAQKGYWQRLEVIEVVLIAEKQGWFLQKYMVSSSSRSSSPVSRRYSDFVWLLDTLIKRYPFRLLPALPPKKIGPGANFLEQRRKALRRFLNMVVNHPVLKDDGALNVFLTEPNFEAWRKRVKVSTEEESASKKLNPAQEMAIPADLEEKLGVLRDHLPAVLASHQKLVAISERQVGRMQAASGDAVRLSMALQSVGEEMPSACYRCAGGGEGCSLCQGVARGLTEVGSTWARAAELGERRVSFNIRRLKSLKSQRDLYLAARDLFFRHDRLSKDSVDALRKKVDGRNKKLEILRQAAKPGWETEADKLVSATDQDTGAINNLLSRRVFIRACMWHELQVVFHTRQAAQATLGWRDFVRDAEGAAKADAALWGELSERLEGVPVE
ncbi:hypothetical protein TREMEDRAFT_34173 [Tremella mesenterica DSM 1558]|uniref:uncharacterized protein n=1 Tax=Tremella mesenterica (strain ATCC 24925 / CBS 8224 / DSM 1558 / NBRC 9311 / NRRL Y-6157 / RJB 2259-6 / UBC 559-6) TaxID=578456 RepID=UPI0003F49C81|nr:uncharacterized protein TREMEDRAFT_34173 [Tremella mesenterica DSM 1558]EIW66873.1 hypothetical protein TREMEDRAFT_34173 [Tremella mesenterica DSM 1558]